MNNNSHLRQRERRLIGSHPLRGWIENRIGTDTDCGVAFRRRWLLQLATSIFVGALFCVTWPLWLGASEFPRIPLLRVAGALPPVAELAALCGLVGSLAMLACHPPRRRLFSVVSISASLLLIAADQHRLQPWLWQFVILQLFMAILNGRFLVTYARLLLVSIYVFSAISKLDYLFLHTIGQQFVDVVCSGVSIDNSTWSDEVRASVPAVFPIAELLVGLGLVAPKTRTFASYAAIVLHIVLLAILGPWGLQHQLGVLVWNAFFVALVAILFLIRTSSRPPEDTDSSPPSEVLPSTRAVIASLIIVLPAVEPLGLLDHWPAWQLYAPRNSRAQMSILDSAVTKLPSGLQNYVRPSTNSFWRRVDLEKWSVDTRHVPIYPQDRFQLGVAIHVATAFDLGGAVQVKLLGPSSRWDGKRPEQTLRGTDEMIQRARDFRWNALPTSD